MYSLTLYLSVFVMCYFKLLCFQINLSKIFQTWILGFYAECVSECLSENLKIDENFSGFRVNYKQ